MTFGSPKTIKYGFR